MSRVQVEQMNDTECLVFIRSLRPIKAKKYRLEKHPNYKYTAEADKKNLRNPPYLLSYNDEEMESVRVKAPGEEGYILPAVVDSARKRALEVEKKKSQELLIYLINLVRELTAFMKKLIQMVLNLIS